MEPGIQRKLIELLGQMCKELREIRKALESGEEHPSDGKQFATEKD